MANHPTITPSAARHALGFRLGYRLRRTAGFSLVEVLVSIVVLSFGLLGMAGMQAAAMRSNREARYQSTATVLVRELAEAIRGNKVQGALSGASAANNPYVGTFGGGSSMAATTPTYCMSVASGTTACADTVAVANAEMTEWLARVDAELPGSRVAVCFDSTPFGSTGTGVPRWACDGVGNMLVIKMGWTRGSTDRTKTGNDAFEHTTDTSSRPSIVVPFTPGI